VRQDSDPIGGLIELLPQFVSLARGYTPQPIWTPAEGSEGDREVRNREVDANGNPWGPTPPRVAYALMHLYLEALIETLDAAHRLVVPPRLAMGGVTVGRSALEAAATLWWLAEPGVEARVRVARVWSEELRSAREGSRATRDLPASERSDYVNSEDEVLAFIGRLGMRSSPGDPRVEDQVRPDSTSLIARMFREEFEQPDAGMMFPVYSGVAHALLWRFAFERGRGYRRWLRLLGGVLVRLRLLA
jgi:hypothetical protein